MFRLALILIVMFVPSVAAAQTSIAVVDVKRLMNASDAAVSIQDQREALKNKYLQEITVQEQALRAEEKRLEEKTISAGDEVSANDRQNYEGMLLEARRFSQDRKRKLEEASRRATEALRETVYVIIQEMANENSYGLVISNQNVIAGEKSLEITDEALERLNKRLPKISLDIEE